MKKFVTKHKNIVIVVGIILVIIIIALIRSASGANESATTAPTLQNVEVMAFSQYGSGEPLNFVGKVVASDESALTPEISGAVTQVLVKEGDKVKKGQTLVQLKNSDQSIAYNQAQVQLENQQLTLQKLEKEYRGSDNSVQGTLTEQQELQVKNAYQAFLNNDLQAYPVDNPERQDGGAPEVSGTYQSTQEGSYIVEVYQSGTDSGASIRLSGLESGTYPASTKFPTAIGTRGLFLQFPEDFRKNSEWIIEIPNKRSSSYVTAKNAYEAAQAGKDLALDQSAVTEEQLQQQRNAVRQQQLTVSQAALSLEKTRIKAPFDGTIIDFDISQGVIVTAFSPIGTIKTLGDLELEFSVSNRERLLLEVGDQIVHEGEVIGEISYIAESLDTGTFKNNIRGIINNTEGLTEGDNLPVEIISQKTDGSEPNETPEVEPFLDTQLIVPLTSIQIIRNTSHVAVVDDMNQVQLKPVEVGLLLGNQIEIVSGLDGSEIVIVDSRGLEAGETVTY